MRGRGPKRDKAQVKLEEIEKLDKKYRIAREKFLRVAKGKTAQDFYPTLSAGTLKRIHDEVEVSSINKLRLIELMGGGGLSNRVYDGIASRIGQAKDEKRRAADLCGKYRYFRQDNPTTGGESDLDEGKIEIFKDDNGDIAFRHWPPDLNHEAEPEHEGYAFLVDDKLFMLGWKTGVLRLGIANCSDDCDGVMHGYVLSVRSAGGGHLIFSAPSVLVSEKRPDELEKFRIKGEDAKKHFSKRHPGHFPDYQFTTA